MSKKEKIKEEKSKKPRVDTFPKAILLLIELHGMACVTASYVLAFINHMTVVENLSITIVGQIIAPLICYLTGSVISNVFEKNQLTFSTPLSAIESGIIPVSTDTISSSVPDEYINFSTEETVVDDVCSFEFDGCSGLGEDET